MDESEMVVLKFGSSVLRDPAGLPDVADEIYRHLRVGKRVLSVVSAFEGHTDRLLREASAVFGEEAPEATATYIATGELQSAAMLTGALLRDGICARTIDPREVHLRIDGDSDLLNAKLVSVDRSQIFKWFKDSSVLVLPGFFGIGDDGRIGLLGRGGSDYTALFLAQRLHSSCRLLKDVAGVYNLDPATAGREVQRFATVGWDVAADITGRLIQPKAMRLAQSERIAFAVGALSEDRDTKVGEYSVSFANPHIVAPPMKIALLGLGIVGGGVCARLMAQPDRFDLQCVVVKHRERYSRVVPEKLLSTDAWDAVRGGAEVVVECMGGLSPCFDVVLGALKAGQIVISSNTAMMARYSNELDRYMNTKPPRLRFSAAVGGALPILELLARHVGQVRIIRAVINEPYNPRSGCPISHAYACDVIGLMAIVGFNTILTEGSIAVEGVDGRAYGADARLVTTIARNCGTLRANLSVQKLDYRDFLAGADASHDRMEMELDDGRVLRLRGRGFGRWPTVISVCGDMLQVWREYCGQEYSHGASNGRQEPSAPRSLGDMHDAHLRSRDADRSLLN